MNDKKELNEQVELLTGELKSIEAVNKKKFDDLRSSFQRELKAKQDSWAAAEKQRRDKWQQDKIAEIKA